MPSATGFDLDPISTCCCSQLDLGKRDEVNTYYYYYYYYYHHHY